MTISRVFVANRGEIAVRIICACHALGIEAIAGVSDADRESLPAKMADRAICIGPVHPRESYLNIAAIVTAASGTRSDAVHPGYGFLAEEPNLAEACSRYGIKFIGPRPENILDMGNKLQARRIAREAGVPVVPGSEKVNNGSEALAVAENIGFPVLLKAAAGGGGRGMKIVPGSGSLREAFGSAAAEARASFGDDTLYIERYIPNAKHIEVQIFGDRFGKVVHLGDRDCSLQRRYQKVVEEALAPFLTDELREKMRTTAVTLAQTIGYENAGTVEFIVDPDHGEFYFLEMNTRIQVEHPVTEAITGLDLVQAQILIADGQPLGFTQSTVRFTGHAVECRINAESPAEGFRPCPGRLMAWSPAEGEGIRVDSHCFSGYSVPPFYDSLLAKLIAWGTDRTEAIQRMQQGLESFVADGIETTIPFLRFLLGQRDFNNGRVHTRWAEERAEEFRGGDIE